jgi:hypothetical protein
VFPTFFNRVPLNGLKFFCVPPKQKEMVLRTTKQDLTNSFTGFEPSYCSTYCQIFVKKLSAYHQTSLYVPQVGDHCIIGLAYKKAAENNTTNRIFFNILQQDIIFLDLFF